MGLQGSSTSIPLTLSDYELPFLFCLQELYKVRVMSVEFTWQPAFSLLNAQAALGL